VNFNLAANWIKSTEHISSNKEKVSSLSLIFLVLLLLSNIVQAQTIDKWVLEFSGKVIDDKNNIEMQDVQIILYRDKTELNKVRTTPSGAFVFKIPQDGEYTIIFSKAGYTPKKLSINTLNVPKEISDKTAVFRYNGAKVYLFEVIPDLDVSILEQPIGKIYFDLSQKNFDYDKEYTKSIKTKVEVLSKALEVKKQKELEKAMEVAKQKSEFDKLIADGDVSLNAKRFDEAVLFYTKALNLNVDNTACNSKIKDAKEAKKADELAKKQAEFDRYINEGNTLLASKKFDEAVIQYNKGFLMNYDNQKATERIENCKLEKKKDEFDRYLKDGDQLITQKKFDEGIKEYQKALAMNFDNGTSESKIKLAQNYKSDAILAKKKSEFDGYVKTGDDLLAQKQFDNSVKEYQKALAMSFDNPTAEAKILTVKKTQEDEIKTKKRIQFDNLISAGDLDFGAKKYDDAISKFKKAVELNFNNELADQKIKLTIESQKAEAEAKAKAEADAKAAAELAKKKAEFEAAIKKGDDALAGKKFDDAIAAFNNALAIKFDDATANAKIGQAQQAKIAEADRQKAEAEAKAKAAAELAKKKAIFDKNIKTGDEKLALNKFDDALSSYNSALETEVDNVLANAKINAARKAKVDEEERIKSEIEAKARLEALKKAKEEANAKAKLEAEQNAIEEAEARAEREAREKILAEVEAAKKNREDAIKKAAEEAKLKAETEARKKAEAEAAKKAKDEQTAKLLAEAEAAKAAKAKKIAENEPKKKTETANQAAKSDPVKGMTDAEKAQKEAQEAEAKAKAELARKMTEAEREEFLSDLAKKYPEGVTTEEQNFAKMKITRIIVVKNKKAHEYKMIVFPYGTYYKKDGSDISKSIFDAETKNK
jgi:hypothetical protein